MFRFLIILALAFLIITFLKGFIKKKSEKDALIKETDTLDEKFNAEKRQKELTIDEILDKVSTHGIDSLSTREREFLDHHAKGN